MTQQSLAAALHVTDKAVSKWERGLSLPDICLFSNLANVLSVSTSDLLLECSDEETPSHLVQIYEDGQACLDMVSSFPPDYYDLILMDICMPSERQAPAINRAGARGKSAGNSKTL
jgi:transcriptional regulator with XRE-family HTH domain